MRSSTTTSHQSPSTTDGATRTAARLGTSIPTGKVVFAWQPSHQNDTGDSTWHEYLVCGDIVDRTMRLAAGTRHVKAWDISHGLTGTNNYRPAPVNTKAFDAELAIANREGAKYFIAIHNDSGAPSGILAECLPGDAKGRALAETLLRYVCRRTGLPSRGVFEVRLYSLASERNKARHRALLEVGDGVKDRRFLESKHGRQLIARGLADAVRALTSR